MAIMPPFQGGEGSSNLLTRSNREIAKNEWRDATRFLIFGLPMGCLLEVSSVDNVVYGCG